MAVHYRVYFQKSLLPADAQLEQAIQEIVPSFQFSEKHDFRKHSGYCVCVMNGTECGFEWEMACLAPEEAGIDGSAYSHYGTLSFRSSKHDEFCAQLFAAALARLAKGMIELPDGGKIEGSETSNWIKQRNSLFPAGKKTRARKKKRSPSEQLSDWFDELVGASVRLLVQSLPDDPYISIVFSTNKRIAGGYWSFDADDGRAFSTLALRRDVVGEQVRKLEEGRQELAQLLRKADIGSVSFDLVSLAARIAFSGGQMAFFARAETPLITESYWERQRCWSMMDSKMVTIKPDLDSGDLIFW